MGIILASVKSVRNRYLHFSNPIQKHGFFINLNPPQFSFFAPHRKTFRILPYQLERGLEIFIKFLFYHSPESRFNLVLYFLDFFARSFGDHDCHLLRSLARNSSAPMTSPRSICDNEKSMSS